METTQITQMVNWLDEELRRERAETGKLQQMVERQAAEMVDLSRQIRELEGRLANTQAQLSRLSNLDDTLDQFKSEFRLMLERQDDQRRQEQRESERLRAAERETQSKAISELRKELQPLPRYEEELRLRKAEDQRLGELLMTVRHEVTNVGKDFDERTRNISYLAEQRAYDNKRLTEVQEETLTLLKRTESHDTKLISLEDRYQRQERHIQALLQFRTEQEREREEWVEGVKLENEQRKREMAEWRQEVEVQREEVHAFTERMREFSDVAEKARQALAALESFKETMRRDQNQVAELQRLAEERQRKELDEWQTQDLKRWKKHELEWEHQWKESYNRHNEIVNRLTGLVEEIKTMQVQLGMLWRLQEIQPAHRLGELQRWQSELDKALDEREKLTRERGR